MLETPTSPGRVDQKKAAMFSRGEPLGKRSPWLGLRSAALPPGPFLQVGQLLGSQPAPKAKMLDKNAAWVPVVGRFEVVHRLVDRQRP